MRLLLSVFPPSRTWTAILFTANTESTLYCQYLFSSSAIIASHSCGPCHADCLAFSFLGGSIEALTCSVLLYSTCSFSLLLPARQHSPPPTSLPERQRRRSGRDKPFPCSPFNSLSLSSPQFFPLLLCISFTLPVHLSKPTPLPTPALSCQREVKEVSYSKVELAALFHITPHRVL